MHVEGVYDGGVGRDEAADGRTLEEVQGRLPVRLTGAEAKESALASGMKDANP